MQEHATKPVGVGVIGCGNISGIYLQNARRLDILEVVACADIDVERARARAAEYNVPRACTVEELLADPAVELVINLTIPAAHLAVGLMALVSISLLSTALSLVGYLCKLASANLAGPVRPN